MYCLHLLTTFLMPVLQLGKRATCNWGWLHWNICNLVEHLGLAPRLQHVPGLVQWYLHCSHYWRSGKRIRAAWPRASELMVMSFEDQQFWGCRVVPDKSMHGPLKLPGKFNMDPEVSSATWSQQKPTTDSFVGRAKLICSVQVSAFRQGSTTSSFVPVHLFQLIWQWKIGIWDPQRRTHYDHIMIVLGEGLERRAICHVSVSTE